MGPMQNLHTLHPSVTAFRQELLGLHTGWGHGVQWGSELQHGVGQGMLMGCRSAQGGDGLWSLWCPTRGRRAIGQSTKDEQGVGREELRVMPGRGKATRLMYACKHVVSDLLPRIWHQPEVADGKCQ